MLKELIIYEVVNFESSPILIKKKKKLESSVPKLMISFITDIKSLSYYTDICVASLY